MIVRTYRPTVSFVWYDGRAGFGRESEIHIEATRKGSVRTNRRRLAEFAVPYYQRMMYRKYGIWIPRRRIKIRFEREQRARKASRLVSVEARIMRYRGRHWKATRLPSRVIKYPIKRRKARRRRRRHA